MKQLKKVKDQKSGFLSIMLGTLGASLLENLLTSKRVMWAGKGATTASLGRGTIKAASSFSKFWVTKVLSTWI